MTASPHSHSLGYPQAWVSAFLQNPGKHGRTISRYIVSLPFVWSLTDWAIYQLSIILYLLCAEPGGGGRLCSSEKASLLDDPWFEFQPGHLLIFESVFLFPRL